MFCSPGRRAGGDAGADELHQPAHGAFAMAGGYVTVLLMQRPAVLFLADACRWLCRPAADRRGRWSARCTARCTRGRTSTRCCSPSAWCSWRGGGGLLHGSARSSRSSSCPEFLRGASRSGGVGIGRYRLFIIVVCLLLTGILQGAARQHALRQPPARAVDDPRVAAGLGINVNAVFSVTFAVASGLAGPGRCAGRRGARPGPELSAEVHDLFPHRRVGRRHDDHHRPAAGRACWASPTWRASTTCPSSAPSSSTA